MTHLAFSSFIGRLDPASARARLATLGAMVGATLGAAACSSIPPGRTVVDAVKVTGADEVDESDILDSISTTASPKFLKLWSGVLFDYSFYDRFALRRDMARVERFYRARGFYEARARVARVVPGKAGHVSVTIDVEEGPPITLRSATLRGLEGVPKEVEAAALAATNEKMKKGRPFDEEEFDATEGAIRRALTDRGYAYATVTRVANVDLPAHAADARFDIIPNAKAKLGKVSVEGLGNLPEAPVRRALDLDEGEEYSTKALESAQQAVLDLGVFTSVTIEPQLTEPAPDDPIVPVIVRLEPTALHAVQLGVGVEFDMIKTDLHGLAQWEAKNFFGGMRNFTVRDRPGVVFYPTRVSDLQAPTHLLPENRLRADLRQPGFLEARTTGRLRGEYNVYPLLLGANADDKSSVIGYHEVIGSAGLERSFWKVFVNPSYNIQSNFPFAYTGPSPIIGSVIVSYVELLTTLDFRDDKIHPRKGILASLDLQAAGGFLQGDAKDLRVQPDVRGYVPISKRVTIAARASVGFLFPQNYGDTYTDYASKGVAPANASPDWTRDLQILFFRGFYSGGATNRGYPLRGVGPHGAVPFFNPEVAAQQFASECQLNSPDFKSERCRYPLGGLSLWEASLELRFPISGPLTGTIFCDTSDVSPHRVSLRFNRPHLSCGAGARYDTPVGPIRLDVGYRIPKLQAPASVLAGEEGDPPLLFGFFPGAIAFGIGEAF